MLSWGLLKPDTLALICADLGEARVSGWGKTKDTICGMEARDALIALVGRDEALELIEKAGGR